MTIDQCKHAIECAIEAKEACAKLIRACGDSCPGGAHAAYAGVSLLLAKECIEARLLSLQLKVLSDGRV